MRRPYVGLASLKADVSAAALRQVQVEMVRNLDQFQQIVAVRAIGYIDGQHCPYDEEFDGNDFAGSHLLATIDGRPVGTIRMRWFAGFAKLERLCVLPGARARSVAKVLIAYALDLAARKGYSRVIAQIQSRLWTMWHHITNCKPLAERTPFTFSDYTYQEIEIALKAHPGAIHVATDPLVMIRPEGYWDDEGVLDRSAARAAHHSKAAA